MNNGEKFELQATEIECSYREVVEAIIKKKDLKEGIWMLHVKFGLMAQNLKDADGKLLPTVMNPLLSVGLLRVSEESNIAVDARKVNSSIFLPH